MFYVHTHHYLYHFVLIKFNVYNDIVILYIAESLGIPIFSSNANCGNDILVILMHNIKLPGMPGMLAGCRVTKS